MVIISTVANDDGVDQPPTTAGAGDAYHRPAGYHASLFGHPAAAASYVAGTAPSSLPPFPSTATASWASNSVCSPSPPLHQNHMWHQLQPTAQAFSSFLDSGDLQTGGGGDGLYAMVAPLLPPRTAVATFTQPAVPPPPPVQMKPAAAMAPVPLAVVPATLTRADHTVLQDTRSGQAAKPAPRRRGRPRKATAAAAATSAATGGTNRGGAPRRAASAKKSAPASSGQVPRQGQPAIAVAAAAGDQTAPCTNSPAALPVQEQHQLQPTSSGNPSTLTWEEEAAIMDAAMGSYADMSAPGVRFHPTDEEIIVYLRRKYLGRKMPVDFIKDFDVYQAHPETVKDTCGESVDGCWYVFSPRNRRYPRGVRPARTVGEVGFWKSNTKKTKISVDGKADGKVIGKVTALTFELGHQPHGQQTAWKMKEYCIPEKQHKPNGSLMLLDEWVLCKLFCNGHGGQSGEADEVGEQSGEADEDAEETKGDEDKQALPMDQTTSNSEQDLCVEDYVIDTEHNPAAY